MTVSPSSVARFNAKKRAKARNRTDAPLNMMDVLKALDKEAARNDRLEKKVSQLEGKVNWLLREIKKYAQY